MEQAERELVERALPHSRQLQKLYREHQYLNERIARVGRRPFLTSRDELELRTMKRRKLSGLEVMLHIARGVEAPKNDSDYLSEVAADAPS